MNATAKKASSNRLRGVFVRARLTLGEKDPVGAGWLSKIVARLAERGLDVGVTFVTESGSERREPVGSLHDLIGILGARGTGYFVASDRDIEDPARSGLTLWIEDYRIEIDLRVGGDELHRRRGTLMDDALSFLTALHGDLGTSGKMGIVAAVGPADVIVYPRPRPPRHHRLWSQRNLADVVSRRYHAEEPGGVPEEVEKMSRAPMPEGAVRVDLGDLVILRWVRDFAEEDDVVNALSTRDAWFAEVLGLPIDPEWSGAGDQRLLRSARPHGPLLHYNSSKRVGYVSILASETRILDQARFEEALSWIRARELPDDTPLDALRAVVPAREVAVALHDRLIAAGFDRVAFPDDHGVLWDPSPPGPWRNDSASSGR